MGIDIGSRLELFVDDYLIDRLDGAELRMHQPSPQGVALLLDEPWEGNSCNYFTVIPGRGSLSDVLSGAGY